MRPALEELRSLCTDFKADGVVSDLEAAALYGWISAHKNDFATLGLEDIPARLEAILEDLVISEEEREELLPMLVAILAGMDQALAAAPTEAVVPAPFVFDEPAAFPAPGSMVVVTGLFLKGARKKVEAELQAGGWRLAGKVSQFCDVVLVGSVPSPGWSKGVYGNKIADVLALKAAQKQAPLLISEAHWRKLNKEEAGG